VSTHRVVARGHAFSGSCSRCRKSWICASARLFDQSEQRTPAQRRSRIARFVGRDIDRRYLVAQRLQFSVGNAVELHPEIESGHRYQMRRLRIAAVGERSPTFLEGCENRKQSFVRINHRLVPLPNSSNPSLAQRMVDHLKAIVQRAINLGGRGSPARLGRIIGQFLALHFRGYHDWDIR
jgi:hypothetical protein